MNLSGLKEFKQHLLSPSYYITAGLFIAVILIVTLVFIPSLTKIRTITTSIDTERTELEKLYTRGQVVHEVKIKLEQAKKDIPLIEATILKSGTELEWIKLIETMAARHSIDQKLNLGATVQENGLSMIPFTMEVKGDWRDVIAYVRDIERLDWYIRLTNFEATQDSNDTKTLLGNGRVSALIKIDTFWH